VTDTATAHDDDELPPSIAAVDLSFRTMPGWLRAATLHRFTVTDIERDRSWHTYMRAALDNSRLPWVHRTTMRVLVDWHGTNVAEVNPRLGDVAQRIPVRREAVSHAVTDLARWAWLAVTPAAGKPSILALLCPVDDPPDRTPPVRVAHTPPVRVAHTPVRVAHTPYARGAQHRGKGQGASTGEAETHRFTRPGAVPPDAANLVDVVEWWKA
jgi:hypothetical protein